MRLPHLQWAATARRKIPEHQLSSTRKTRLFQSRRAAASNVDTSSQFAVGV